MKKNWKKILSVIISLALVVFLLSQIDLVKGFRIISQMSLAWIILGFLAYLASVLLRALRWRILIHSKLIDFKDIFRVTILHIMFNNLLPARSGELTYLYFLKKNQAVSVAEGAATLLAARIFDVLTIVLLFLFSIFWAGLYLSIESSQIILWSLGLLIILILILFYLTKISRVFLKIFEEMIKKTWLKKSSLALFLINRSEAMIESLAAIRQKGIYLSILIISLMTWLAKFLMIAFLLIGLDIHLNLWQIVFGASLTQVANALPIQALAGFGTHEAAWTIAFIWAGLDKEMAIISGFAIHILGIIYALILVGYAVGFIKNKTIN